MRAQEECHQIDDEVIKLTWIVHEIMKFDGFRCFVVSVKTIQFEVQIQYLKNENKAEATIKVKFKVFRVMIRENGNLTFSIQANFLALPQ